MWFISLKYLESWLKQKDFLNKHWSKPKFVTEPELNQKYQYDDSLPRLVHNGLQVCKPQHLGEKNILPCGAD